jgi:hypothetical protein
MPGRLVFRGAFNASADDGTDYLIDVFQLIHDGTEGTNDEILLYRTTDGKPINRVRQGEFQIQGTGLMLYAMPGDRACVSRSRATNDRAFRAHEAVAEASDICRSVAVAMETYQETVWKTDHQLRLLYRIQKETGTFHELLRD